MKYSEFNKDDELIIAFIRSMGVKYPETDCRTIIDVTESLIDLIKEQYSIEED